MRAVVAGAVIAAAAAIACGRPAPAAGAAELARLPWDSVLARARGTTVTWRMWRGDPSVNRYIDQWVAPRLKRSYGIDLRAVEGQGPAMVNALLVERSARARGSADLLWINGETFHQLRTAGLLAGPWAGVLPNDRYVDSASRIIMRDFEQPTDGLESPWGTVQFALIYDSLRTPSPPRTYAELAEWIRAHPGRFTYDQGFTGITFLKQLLYVEAGGAGRLAGGFDSVRYRVASAGVWAWLDSVRPALWRGGAAYPREVAELHRLFANQEVDFSMSFNQNDVLAKSARGLLPMTARALVLRDGTIANAHYVGIPVNAPNPAGAMVVADFLLSPEAQFEKQRPEVWADGTVLDPARLPPEWAERFRTAERDPRAVPRDTLARYARPEVAPEYHEHLAADWRERVRETGQ
ncbi:MAG: ABC transporter substrate-binding protein [Gemmatimonadota bacterium]